MRFYTRYPTVVREVVEDVPLGPEAADKLPRVEAPLDLLGLRPLLADGLPAQHLRRILAHPGDSISVYEAYCLPIEYAHY